MANKISFPVNTSEKEDAVCSNKKYGKKKGKRPDSIITELEPKEKLKYEIAEELGLLDLRDAGWVEVINIKRDRTDWRNGHRKKTRDKKTDKNCG